VLSRNAPLQAEAVALIYITGDVHNYLGPDLDQVHDCINEPAAALRYASLAADFGLKVTLFVTGLALREQPERFRAILSLGNVEIGGHGWDSLKIHRARTALWSIFGSRYGPKPYQRYEIRKTLDTFKQCLEYSPQVWRGHAYYTDEHTYALLRSAGIHVVSDEVVCFDRPKSGIQELLPGLWSVPINTMPDHDTVVHAKMSQADIDCGTLVGRAMRDLHALPTLTPKMRMAIVARRLMKYAFDVRVMPYSAEYLYVHNRVRMLSPSEWESLLLQQIKRQVEEIGFAVLLLHPVCMTALDDMATLGRIFRYCCSFPSRFMSEAIPH
jgi:peptidoglycan/xylan/chitin deacetylase (PgdA/CDA1 family)